MLFRSHGRTAEVFIYPSRVNGGGVVGPEVQGYQIVSTPIYPSLLPNSKHCTSKTPLIPKAKVKCAPSKTNWLGVILAFMSGVFFTLCSGTVKYLTDIDPMELLIFRSLFQVSLNSGASFDYYDYEYGQLIIPISPFQVALTLPIAICKSQNVLGPPG